MVVRGARLETGMRDMMHAWHGEHHLDIYP